MSNILLGTENYFDSAVANSITTSSANPTFPVANAFRFQRRGRVFRTAGNFVIASGANVIKFNDGGSLLTATITAGTYLVGSTLLAAIKAALEAASAHTYTVTWTADRKIRISTNHTTLQLITTNAGFTAADVLGFSTGADLTGATAYTASFPRSHTEEWIKIDMGAAVNPQAFILIGKRNEDIKISEDAVVTLQGNSFDVWTAPEFSATLEVNNNAIYLSDEDGIHTQPLRYWRLLIQDRESIYGFIEISNIFIGRCMAPERGAIQWGMSNKLTDFSVTVNSESGVSLSEKRSQTEDYGFTFGFLTKTDFSDFRFHWELHGTSRPWFVILDPNEFVVNDPAELVKYVRFQTDTNMRFERPNIFSADVALREEI